MSQLYLLRAKTDPEYDAYDAHLIRAEDAKGARRFANISPGDEGSIWEDPKLSSCRQLKIEGKLGIILSSFNAG